MARGTGGTGWQRFGQLTSLQHPLHSQNKKRYHGNCISCGNLKFQC